MVWAPGKPPAPPPWADVGEARAVAAAPGDDEDPALLRLHNGTYLLAWTSPRSGTSGLWLAWSADGVAWSAPRQPFTGPDGDFYPTLAQRRDGSLDLAWFRINATHSVPNIWHSRSPDGMAWSVPRMVAGSISQNWAPRLAVDRDDTAWLAWSSERGGGRDVWLVQSTAAGWGNATAVTDHPWHDDFPALLSQGGGLRLAFVRYDPDRGWGHGSSELLESTLGADGNWSEPRQVTDGSSRFTDTLPCWVDVDGVPWLAWTSTRVGPAGGIVAAPLDDMGAVQRVTKDGYSPTVAPGARAGSFLLAWVAGGEGKRDIFVREVQFDGTAPSA